MAAPQVSPAARPGSLCANGKGGQMQTLDASSEINAPAEVVWQVVSDFASYPEWNPFIVRATGEQRPGARLQVTIAAPGVRAVTFKPTVLDLRPGRLIRWKGRLLVPGLFDGRHALSVDPLGDGRARFTTHEEVTGVLLPFLGKVMKASQEGFERMAAAVKVRAEALSAESAGARPPQVAVPGAEAPPATPPRPKTQSTAPRSETGAP